MLFIMHSNKVCNNVQGNNLLENSSVARIKHKIIILISSKGNIIIPHGSLS